MFQTNRKKIGASFLLFFILFTLSMPAVANAANPFRPLIVCGYKDMPANDQECKFPHLIKFVQNLIHDLTILALPLAAVAFAWAGFLILTAAGDEGKVKEGREVFMKVGIGFAWIIAAYFLINFLLVKLVDPAQIINFL